VGSERIPRARANAAAVQGLALVRECDPCVRVRCGDVGCQCHGEGGIVELEGVDGPFGEGANKEVVHKAVLCTLRLDQHAYQAIREDSHALTQWWDKWPNTVAKQPVISHQERDIEGVR